MWCYLPQRQNDRQKSITSAQLLFQAVMIESSIIPFYRPQRSWGKVIFSEACVKNSVHRGVCMVGAMHGGGHKCWGGVCGGGHAWQEGCVWQGGHVWRGAMWGPYVVGCAWWGHAWHGGDMRGKGGMHGIWSVSGRYASNWNAFLLLLISTQARSQRSLYPLQLIRLHF